MKINVISATAKLVIMAAIVQFACTKDDAAQPPNIADPAGEAVAVSGMNSSFSSMMTFNDSLINAPQHHQRLKHDSAYHHHDSLYTHHHNKFHNGDPAHGNNPSHGQNHHSQLDSLHSAHTPHHP